MAASRKGLRTVGHGSDVVLRRTPRSAGARLGDGLGRRAVAASDVAGAAGAGDLTAAGAGQVTDPARAALDERARTDGAGAAGAVALVAHARPGGERAGAARVAVDLAADRGEAAVGL